MVQRIVFTQTASNTFVGIMNYLEENYSLQTAQNLANEVDKQIIKLKIQPFIGRPSQKAKTVRIIKVAKHLQMMYRVHGTTLIISNFFDTRQNPEKSPF